MINRTILIGLLLFLSEHCEFIWRNDPSLFFVQGFLLRDRRFLSFLSLRKTTTTTTTSTITTKSIQTKKITPSFLPYFFQLHTFDLPHQGDLLDHNDTTIPAAAGAPASFEQDTLDYLYQQFLQLTPEGKSTINFDLLCNWEEIQHLFEQEVITKKELKKIYLQYCSSLSPNLEEGEGITFEQFITINAEIDKLIEYEEEITNPEILSNELQTILSSSSSSSSTVSSNGERQSLEEFEEALRKELGFSVIQPKSVATSADGNNRESDETFISTDFKTDSSFSGKEDLTNDDYDTIMGKITQKNLNSNVFPEDNVAIESVDAPLPDNLPLSNRKLGNDDDFFEEYEDEYSSNGDVLEEDVSYTNPETESEGIIPPQSGTNFAKDEYTDSIEGDEEDGSRDIRQLPSLNEDTVEEDEEENDLTGMDIKDVNVWDSQIRAEDLFQKEFIRYLSDFFHENVKDHPNHLLSFQQFYEWEDIQGLIAENNIEMTILKNVWIEATEYERIRFGFEKLSVDNNSNSSSSTTPSRFTSTFASKLASLPFEYTEQPLQILQEQAEAARSNREPDIAGNATQNLLFFTSPEESGRSNHNSTNILLPIQKKTETTLLFINLDTFIRLNYRLEQIVEDIQEVFDKMVYNDQNKFYHEAFLSLTSHHQIYQNSNFNRHFNPIITYEEILEWDYLQQLFSSKQIDLPEIQALYSIFPLEKQVLSMPVLPTSGAASGNSGKSKGKGKDMGIGGVGGSKLKSSLPVEFSQWPKLTKKMELKEIYGIDREKFVFFCQKVNERISEKNKANNKGNNEKKVNRTRVTLDDQEEIRESADNDSILE